MQVVIVEDEASEVGIGSLCVKSPGMFREYWKLPQVHLSNHAVLNFCCILNQRFDFINFFCSGMRA